MSSPASEPEPQGKAPEVVQSNALLAVSTVRRRVSSDVHVLGESNMVPAKSSASGPVVDSQVGAMTTELRRLCLCSVSNAPLLAFRLQTIFFFFVVLVERELQSGRSARASRSGSFHLILVVLLQVLAQEGFLLFVAAAQRALLVSRKAVQFLLRHQVPLEDIQCVVQVEHDMVAVVHVTRQRRGLEVLQPACDVLAAIGFRPAAEA